MPRTKEFDYDRALDEAIRVFWDKGYEATSIQDLVNATGVNRASLYQSFGGKRELFQKALERFQSADEQSFTCLSAGAAPGLEKIRRVFHEVARQDIRALARFLTNAFFGLRMIAKMQPNRELVDDIVDSTLAALK
jgi:TetR/AcrR family transcriptional repressor of nem operon